MCLEPFPPHHGGSSVSVSLVLPLLGILVQKGLQLCQCPANGTIVATIISGIALIGPRTIDRPGHQPQTVGHVQIELLDGRGHIVQRPQLGGDLQLELGELVALGGGLGPNAAAGRVGIDPDQRFVRVGRIERRLGTGIRTGHRGVSQEVVGHVPALLLDCMPLSTFQWAMA